MKTCTKCGIEKPPVEFSKRTASRDGLDAHCKACVSTRKAAAYAVDSEKIAGYNAVYYAANQEKIAARATARYVANPEKFQARSAAARAADPEKCTAYIAAWRKANPAKVNSPTARRRAVKLQATPIWASREKIDASYYTADMLGIHTGDPYHVDHIVPLRSKLVCGLHVEHNLQVLTWPENCSKGNRHWPDMP